MKKVNAILVAIGMVLIFAGAAIADSASVIPTIILILIGSLVMSPVIIGEIKSEFI